MRKPREWRNYEQMSREELIARLRLAEDVAVRVAWTAISGTERGDALTETWMRWARHPGVYTGPADNQDLIESEGEMVEARRAKRDALRRLVEVHG